MRERSIDTRVREKQAGRKVAALLGIKDGNNAAFTGCVVVDGGQEDHF